MSENWEEKYLEREEKREVSVIEINVENITQKRTVHEAISLTGGSFLLKAVQLLFPTLVRSFSKLPSRLFSIKRNSLSAPKGDKQEL